MMKGKRFSGGGLRTVTTQVDGILPGYQSCAKQPAVFVVVVVVYVPFVVVVVDVVPVEAVGERAEKGWQAIWV